MKTVIIFDENNLGSFMAAACVTQDKDTTMVECKTIKDVLSGEGRTKYIWIGVVPTYLHFPYTSKKEVDAQEHIVLLDNRELTPKQCVPLISTADYVYGIDGNETLSTYGSRTLIERAVSYFKVAPNKALFTVNMVNRFYDKELLNEYILETAFNASNALADLRLGNEFIPEPFTPEKHIMMHQRYKLLCSATTGVISHGSLMNEVHDKKTGAKHAVRTSFLTSMWWFVYRLILATHSMAPYYRNISLSATGTVVTCNVMQVDDLIHMNPVFVR